MPTEADLASTVYRQQWTYKGNSGVSRGFDVLALDADHAKELGLIRLAETGDALFVLDLTRNEPVLDASPAYVQAVLKCEGEMSWHARQEEYARRLLVQAQL
jgi:hypothetical protein